MRHTVRVGVGEVVSSGGGAVRSAQICRMRASICALLISGSMLALAGCTSGHPESATSTSAPGAAEQQEADAELEQRRAIRRQLLPDEVTCFANYRPDESIVGEQEAQLTVQPADRSGRPGLPAVTQQIQFPSMSLEIGFLGEAHDSSHSLTVRVLSSDGAQLQQSHWALRDVDVTAVVFANGQGFTGSHYVSSGTATLQWSCHAVDRNR